MWTVVVQASQLLLSTYTGVPALQLAYAGRKGGSGLVLARLNWRRWRIQHAAHSGPETEAPGRRCSKTYVTGIHIVLPSVLGTMDSKGKVPEGMQWR